MITALFDSADSLFLNKDGCDVAKFENVNVWLFI